MDRVFTAVIIIVVAGSIVSVIPFNQYKKTSSTNATLVPISDVSVAWTPVGTPTVTCAGGTNCGEVDEGTTPNTTNYVQTGTGSTSSVTDTYGLTSTANVTSASQLVLNVYAQSSTNANGGTLDGLNINLIINGTAQTATSVTPVYNSWGWFTATFTGSWTQTQVDALQVSISNTINGSGKPSAQEDNIEVADIYGTLTYVPSIIVSQNSYRIFNNQDSSGPSSFISATGSSTGNVNSNSVVQTSDGGYAETGNSNVYGPGGSADSMFLAKYNANGTLAWSIAWGGSAGYTSGSSVIQTSDGGYAVTGATKAFGPGGTTYDSMFLAKFTSTGALSWSITWGGSGGNTDGNSVVQTSDGGYAVTGNTSAFGPGGTNSSMFLAKFTSTGSLSWSITWGGSAGATAALSLIQTSDGGYAVTGNTSAFGPGGTNSSMFLAKFTSTGSLSWSIAWGGSAGATYGNSIIQTSDGGYAITGNTKAFGPGGTYNSMFLAKFTSTGALSWSITWGASGGDTIGNSVIQSSDGGYVITGYTYAFGPGATSNISMFLVKFNSSGSMLWSMANGASATSTIGTSVVQTSDGGYAVGGETTSFGPGAPSYASMLLAKLDSNGKIANCSSSNCQYGGTNFTPLTYVGGVNYTPVTDIDGTNYTSTTYVDGTNYTSTTDVDGVNYTSTTVYVVSIAPSIDVGSPLAALNTAATVYSGQVFRVRIDLNMSSPWAANATSFELQYATCGGTYANVTTTTPVSYYKNKLAISGMPLTTDTNDPTDSTNTLIRQSYEQAGITSFTNPFAIAAGQDGMWDFALTTTGVTGGQSYCIRIADSNGTALNTYNATPQINITTAAAANSPTSLVQETSAGKVIATGGWSNSTSMTFTGLVSSANATDSIELCVEAEPLGTAFTNTGTCGTAVAYSGTAVTASVTISGYVSGTQYHWQAQALGNGGPSAWVSYGGNPETSSDFGVDTSAPTGGTVYDGTTAGYETTFNNGSLSQLSANWSGFTDTGGSGIASYQYSIGTSPGTTNILGWTNNGSATTVTASGLTLQTSQVYYVNVEAINGAGNVSAPVYSPGQLVAPSLGFSVSPASVQFSLSPTSSTPWTATQTTTLSATTNAYNGFVIRAFMPSLLSSGSTTIPGFTGGTYAAPNSWQSGDTGFGYTSSATSIGGSNIFQSNPCPGGAALTSPGCYAPYSLTAPGDIVAELTGPITGTANNSTFTISDRITTTSTQPAKNYSGIIVYTITATY